MNSITVLLYQHVAPDREITPEAFESQLRWLKEKGYRAIGLSELERRLSKGRQAPSKSIAITFDGGYADQWVYAHPILKRHQMRASAFIPTAFPSFSCLKRLTSEDGGAMPDTRSLEHGCDAFLSWGEIKSMSASAIWDIGAQTHTHKKFDPQASYSSFEDELIVPRQTIESRAGCACFALAWPWGEPVEEWTGRLAKSGYRLAFTNKAGANRSGCDLMRLKRFKVRRPEVAWLKSRLALTTRGEAAKDVLPAIAKTARPAVRTRRRVKTVA